ncbi:MAG TPA: PASTA domain-containing protein [Pseudonocardiaceae bacterium]|nr:PASTA domain-containing protein [Pseudonocardiaceae bacterium]
MGSGKTKLARRLNYSRPPADLAGLNLVPDLTGLSLAEARKAVPAALVISSSTEEPSTGESSTDEGTVVDQHPEPGAWLPAASTVTVRLSGDDGQAGVREPRRPLPPTRTNRARA